MRFVGNLAIQNREFGIKLPGRGGNRMLKWGRINVGGYSRDCDDYLGVIPTGVHLHRQNIHPCKPAGKTTGPGAGNSPVTRSR